MFKRLITSILAMAVALSVPLSSLAATWDIKDGNITVDATGSAQTVKQGENAAEEDSNPVITGKSDKNTVEIKTAEGKEAKITIKDTDITTDGDYFIDVTDAGKASIEFKGNNKVTVKEDGGAIHVSDADVTLKGDGKLTVKGKERNNNALIGSREDEYLTGKINITDDLEINISGESDGRSDGAAIGTGGGKGITGEINIDGNAKVDVTSYDDGAGIGTGYKGDLTGSINIGGNANVKANSSDDGAGIGTGYKGDLTGSINIGGNANVTANSSNDGAGIGTGLEGKLTGSINISGNANVTGYSGDDGAGIGTGLEGDFEGSINIGGKSRAEGRCKDEGTGIGAGEKAPFKGNINIGDNANVEAYGGSDGGAGIGTGESSSGPFEGKVTIDGNAVVKAYGDDDAAGIGAGEGSSVTEDAVITIGGNAKVESYGEGEGTGIGGGGGDGKKMSGTIIIKDNADVKAYGGIDEETDYDSNSAAIGSDDAGTCDGTIKILDNASVTTGRIGLVDGERKIIKNKIGSIGGGENVIHSENGTKFEFGKNVKINGISGTDIDGLKNYVSFDIDENGNPVNVIYEKAIPEEEDEEPLFEVKNIDGKNVEFKQKQTLKNLYVDTQEENAKIIIKRQALNDLLNSGIKFIKFKTAADSVEIDIYKLLAADRNAKVFIILCGENIDDVLADNRSVKHLLK